MTAAFLASASQLRLASQCKCTLLNRMKCIPGFFFGALAAFVLAPLGQAFLFMGPLAGNAAYEEISFAAFQRDISRRSPFQDASLKGWLLPRRPPQLCRRPPLQRQKSLVESQRIHIMYRSGNDGVAARPPSSSWWRWRWLCKFRTVYGWTYLL